MRLSPRASGNAVIKAVMSNSKGIGTSKADSRANSGLKGQNGHEVSSKTHSIATTQNQRSVITQYVNYVKEEYGNRVMENINNETMKEFIDHKLNEDGISGATANTYISELGRISDNLNELGVNSVSREEITSYREDLKEQGVNLQGDHLDRSYNEADKIVENMYNDSPYGLSAELQYEAGLRADDALNSEKWTINEDNSLHIENSKGGVEYDTKILNEELIEKVREAIEQEYKGNYEDYRESLKEAVEQQGEEWNGTHGLRYDFAQERVEELREQGLTDSEALAQTSQEMGHSREEITLHYLSGK
jgi:hypothetical protein